MSNLNFKQMLFLIYHSDNDVQNDEAKSLIKDCIDSNIKISYVKINTKFSKNPIIEKLQYMDLIGKLRSKIGYDYTDQVVIDYTGFSDNDLEILGFIIGYVLSARKPFIINNPELEKKVTELSNWTEKVVIVDDYTTKLFVIRKLQKMMGIPKKINKYLSNLKYTGIEDYILNGMLLYFGHSPFYTNENTKLAEYILKEGGRI